MNLSLPSRSLRRLWLAAPLLALGGCIPAPAIHRVEPGFSGLRFCRLEGNVLGADGLRLDVERSDSVEREPVYQLLLDQIGARELPILPGDSLRLAIGTDTMVLEPAGGEPERRVLESEFLMMRWRYRITADQLQRLAAGGSAELSAPTVHGDLTAAIPPAAVDAVERFMSECSTGAAEVPHLGPARAADSDPWIPVNEQEYTSTPSGLKYKDETVGTGAEARSGNQVSVHYTGWLEDGTKFDSSRDRGQPFEFALGAGSVIRGWDEGVQGMRVGGRRRLLIPPELGYGGRAVGGVIPANSTLVFEVELLGVR
jgi:hypothetical protein